ncbi:hypothetical protein BR93DRAFT_921984 [Coniochaeta sp. PMI_546]|nr:hypothetical protein BR93DRAFT_921984 [Coniochaeta sp. PMI_546]
MSDRINLMYAAVVFILAAVRAKVWRRRNPFSVPVNAGNENKHCSRSPRCAEQQRDIVYAIYPSIAPIGDRLSDISQASRDHPPCLPCLTLTMRRCLRWHLAVVAGMPLVRHSTSQPAILERIRLVWHLPLWGSYQRKL